MNSGEVDDVITLIEDHYKNPLDQKSEYYIRKAIKREFDKDKTTSSQNIANKMILRVGSKISKRVKKKITKKNYQRT